MSNVLNTVNQLLASHRKPASTTHRKRPNPWLASGPELRLYIADLTTGDPVYRREDSISLGRAATAGDAEVLASQAIHSPHYAPCAADEGEIGLVVTWGRHQLAIATAHADPQTFDEMDAGKPEVWRWRVDWPLDTCVAATR